MAGPSDPVRAGPGAATHDPGSPAVEELTELTHLSVRQYQRPNGEVVALLVIAPSKSDRERIIPMSTELFATIAAIIRRHLRDQPTIPLVKRYDLHEKAAFG